MRSSARGSRCCSRNILLNTSLEDGHGGSVRPNSPSRVIFPPVSNDRFGGRGKKKELPAVNQFRFCGIGLDLTSKSDKSVNIIQREVRN